MLFKIRSYPHFKISNYPYFKLQQYPHYTLQNYQLINYSEFYPKKCLIMDILDYYTNGNARKIYYNFIK